MLSLVIDIRSDVIEGALVYFPSKHLAHKAAAPQIVYSASTPLPHTDSGAEYFTKIMVKTLGELCVHIAQELPKHVKGYTDAKIDSIHYVLSTPWIISQSKTVKVEYDKETEITDASIRSILHENHEAFLKTHGTGMVSIERKIFAVEINGYVVDSYHGKKTKSLTVSFAMSISSGRLIKDIQGAVHKSFHIHNEFHHSAILLQYLSSRTRMPEGREYILMNIHGELTDIVIIKKGVSAYLGSFPFGSGTLVRRTSLALSVSPETADSTLSMYEEGKLEESQHQKVKNAVSAVLKDWQGACERSFEGLTKGSDNNVLLPRSVHLAAGSNYLDFFKAVLEELGLTVAVDELPPVKVYIAALYHVI